MTRYACGTTLTLLFLTLTVPALGQNYFLYTPKPVTAEEKPQTRDGVLVREITVQKGDTLSGLSHKFSGRGSYYPQILLFNDIKNPNLIYSGNSIKVPVARGKSLEQRVPAAAAAPKKTSSSTSSAQSAGEIPLSDLKQADAAKNKKQAHRGRKQAPRSEAKKQPAPAAAKTVKSSSASGAKETLSGHKLYEKAYAAYRHGDCKTALGLFDRFLVENPTASQAADASLYKADCYLKLSGQ
jgi:LysM repeat protein